MKQAIMAALAIAIKAKAQDSDLQYDFNFDLILAKEDNKMNPLWKWHIKDGPEVVIKDLDSMIIPNNQVAVLKNTPLEGVKYDYMPIMKGGALQYTVDLSNTDCGCVAGAYAVSIEGGCNPEASFEGEMASPPMESP